MINLLVVTQAEHVQVQELAARIDPGDHDAWLAGLREILGDATVEQVSGDFPHDLFDGQAWHVVAVTSTTIMGADRVIRGATMLYHAEHQGWALIGDERGQLHVLDVVAPPAMGEPQLVDDPRQRLVRYEPPPPGASPSQGGFIRYDDLELKAYRGRRTIIWLAFDQETRTWYRGRRVEHIPSEPYTTR